MSNYPPGVTGGEDHFGPQKEEEDWAYCDGCGQNTEGLLRYWNSHVTWTCDECETEYLFELEEVTDPDDEGEN